MYKTEKVFRGKYSREDFFASATVFLGVYFRWAAVSGPVCCNLLSDCNLQGSRSLLRDCNPVVFNLLVIAIR